MIVLVRLRQSAAIVASGTSAMTVNAMVSGSAPAQTVMLMVHKVTITDASAATPVAGKFPLSITQVSKRPHERTR